MARKKTGDKPSDIRQAVVDEVAAIGSTGVSVNKVAARAQLSVGTVYRYHKSKDELLFWVFMQIKRDIHQALMNAANEHSGAAYRLRGIWFALVEYGFKAPKDFLLVEMMSAEPRSSVQQSAELDQIRAEVLAEIQAGIDQRVLRVLPVAAIETVLASPAITLARRASLSGIQADMDELESVFDILWRGISRD